MTAARCCGLPDTDPRLCGLPDVDCKLKPGDVQKWHFAPQDPGPFYPLSAADQQRCGLVYAPKYDIAIEGHLA